MTEPKTKPSASLRTPGPKKKLGLVVPPALRLPHDELIKSESSIENATMPSQPSQPSHSSQTSHTKQGARPKVTSPPAEDVPISPVKDYTKVANSIRREAVPAGVFKGKSKQLYDQLYGLTRGAVVPKRKVRISRPKLMKLAHIGSRVTFDTNVEHLRSVGLIDITVMTGEHEGNEYEVFIPEELESDSTMPSQTSLPSQTSHAQKLDRLVRLETSQTRHTLSVENTEGYDTPKTSFKTNSKNFDDEAFAPLVSRFRQAVRDVTGRDSTSAEGERWGELAELLITELKIAAGRTGSVSSVPAFLTEHLRRRLWKKDGRQIEEEGKSVSGGQEAAAQVDASTCPDCFGTGMWYPEGFEKGVTKCRHEKLTQAESGAPR
ncbi:MAG TPA: hypothetical protein VF659_13020 [Pyrinomonadaceae bacterium]|jgi:hypothetical protein